MIQIDVEMPKNCDVCMFSQWSNLSQTASCKLKDYEPCFADFSNEYKSKRASFCPLHEVTDSDTISRKQAIDALESDYAYAAAKIIKNLPPSPSRPHDISKAKFSCPICGAEMEVTVDEWDEGGAV